MQVAGVHSLREAQVKGKRVLVRVDINVPMVNGAIGDDTRIKAAIPTLEYLHEQGASEITLLAHWGRPEGKVVESLRLKPIEDRLRSLTSTPFVLHENLRFDPREEANDISFAKELAALGDIYINEAFSDSHRPHSSIVGIPQFLPSYMGLHFEEEVGHLSDALKPPPHSLVLIGGAKFETKEPLILKLLSLYDRVYLGGVLANDLLRSRGEPIGASKVSSKEMPAEIAGNSKVMTPRDVVVREIQTATERVCLVNDVRANEMIVDIGPDAALQWGEEFSRAPFILWNGPTGVYEDGYIDGTDTIAEALSKGTPRVVVGGGDTLAALAKVSFDASRVFVSTGGGAMLQFLVDGTLPGIEALKGKH